jgi:hypothetical protein
LLKELKYCFYLIYLITIYWYRIIRISWTCKIFDWKETKSYNEFFKKCDDIAKTNNLFKFLKNSLNLHEYHTLYSNLLVILSWWAQCTGSKKKIVRFAFNETSLADVTIISRYNRENKLQEQVFTSKVVTQYNYIKWFIDEKHSVTFKVRYLFKNQKLFHSRLLNLYYTYAYDMYIWHRTLLVLPNSFTFYHFLL